MVFSKPLKTQVQILGFKVCSFVKFYTAHR